MTQLEVQNDYSQLCVWHGTTVLNSDHPHTVEQFEAWMMEEFGVRAKYEAEIKTNPDRDKYNNPVPETGGRTDLFFYVHNEDLGKFAIARIPYGIRWWEDVIDNGNGYLYPSNITEKYPIK